MPCWGCLLPLLLCLLLVGGMMIRMRKRGFYQFINCLLGSEHQPRPFVQIMHPLDLQNMSLLNDRVCAPRNEFGLPFMAQILISSSPVCPTLNANKISFHFLLLLLFGFFTSWPKSFAMPLQTDPRGKLLQWHGTCRVSGMSNISVVAQTIEARPFDKDQHEDCARQWQNIISPAAPGR